MYLSLTLPGGISFPEDPVTLLPDGYDDDTITRGDGDCGRHKQGQEHARHPDTPLKLINGRPALRGS